MKKFVCTVAMLLAVVGTTASAQDTTTCAEGLHLFEHELLATDPVCIPDAPERVAALDMTIFELLMIEGNQPVTASETVLNSYIRMHPELEAPFNEVMETTEDMGFPPSIEVILEAKPDLIIGSYDFFTGSLFKSLNDIAPTVLFTPQPGDWRSRLNLAGEVLGLTDTVDGLLADYDARVEELKTALGEEAADIKISLIRTFPDQIGLVLEGTNAAAVLNSVGLVRPEAQTVDYDYVLETLGGRPELLISAEELQLADGDIIFVFGESPQLIDNPLWATLNAVKNEQAFEVGYYWWGDDLLSAHDMLDDLFKYVAKVEPEHTNPFKEGLVVSKDE